MLRSWRGFEQIIWQEWLEKHHKGYVPQGKLTAVYSVQTKLRSLLMSMLFSLLEVLGRVRKDTIHKTAFAFYWGVRYIALCRRKKDRDWICAYLCLLAVITCIMTDCTFQEVWRLLITKCNPLMYCFVLHCAYVRKTWLKSWIVVNTWKLAIYF